MGSIGCFQGWIDFSSVAKENYGISSSKTIENNIFPQRYQEIFACGAKAVPRWGELFGEMY